MQRVQNGAADPLLFDREYMSLRDALLKAGKVKKQDAQRAATELRKQRKKQKGGGHQIELDAQARALARDNERKAERDAENQARVEELRRQRVEHERLMAIANLIKAWTRRPGPKAGRSWHFVRSNGRIGRIMVDQRVAAELEYGAAGIVETLKDPDEVRVVAAEGIRKLAGVYGGGIRFFLGDGGPSDALVRPARYPSNQTHREV